jgi:hypothetical protein
VLEDKEMGWPVRREGLCLGGVDGA